jgi:transposase
VVFSTLGAIAASKKKNDRIDAKKICDCLRCDFLPECYMAPTAIRERRRTLRYRNLLVRQMVQMKNKDRHAADGSRSELQQAKAAQGWLPDLLNSQGIVRRSLTPLFTFRNHGRPVSVNVPNRFLAFYARQSLRYTSR